MDKWLKFYEPFFEDRQSAIQFVERCENLTPENSNHIAKIMMHQTQRLLSIANDMPQIRPQREVLQLLFVLICAENIAKLHDDYTDEGKSRYYVRKFFESFLSDSYQKKIGNGFIDNEDNLLRPLGLRKAIDILYDVRCDVVHEGNYWGLSFHDGRMPMVNVEPNVNVYIRFEELKDIVVYGCITAIIDKLKKP